MAKYVNWREEVLWGSDQIGDWRLWIRRDGGREARRQVLIVTDISCQPEAASLLLPPFFLAHNTHACSCTIAGCLNVTHCTRKCKPFQCWMCIFHYIITINISLWIFQLNKERKQKSQRRKRLEVSKQLCYEAPLKFSNWNPSWRWHLFICLLRSFAVLKVISPKSCHEHTAEILFNFHIWKQSLSCNNNFKYIIYIWAKCCMLVNQPEKLSLF